MSTSLAANNIPRVTEILRPFTGYDQVPKDILERASARGTSTHALCAGIAKGNWIPDGMIGEELIGYVRSFRKWHEAQVKEFVIVEKRYTDLYKRFSGQLDFVVKCHDDKYYLADIKTSAKPQKTYPVQMSAYEALLKQQGIEIEGAMLVYLNKDGEFPDIDFLENMDEEFSVFLSAVKCYEYFKIRKKNGSKRQEHIPENTCDNGGADIHPEGRCESQRAIQVC